MMFDTNRPPGLRESPFSAGNQQPAFLGPPVQAPPGEPSPFPIRRPMPFDQGGVGMQLPGQPQQQPNGFPIWNSMNIPPAIQQLIAQRSGMAMPGRPPMQRQGFIRPGMFPSSPFGPPMSWPPQPNNLMPINPNPAPAGIPVPPIG